MLEDGNPKLPGGLRVFSGAVIVVLLVGAGLFFVPDLVKPRWPWPLAPFNARFLGSFYLAELVAMVALLVWNRWSPARMILVMAFVFTLVVSVTSLINLDHFNFGRKASWLWFAVYAGSAIVSGLFLWNARGTPPVASGDIGRGMAPLLSGRSRSARALRAWPADPAGDVQRLLALEDRCVPRANLQRDLHHRRLPAPGSSRLTRRARSWWRLGAAQLALGLLSIIGLALTDAAVKRVDWSAPGTWAWLLLFAAIAVTGLIKLRGGLARARTAALA